MPNAIARSLKAQRTDIVGAVVPATGEAVPRGALAEQSEMLVTVRQRLAKQIAQGRSLEEAKATRPTAEFDARAANLVAAPMDGEFQIGHASGCLLHDHPRGAGILQGADAPPRSFASCIVQLPIGR